MSDRAKDDDRGGAGGRRGAEAVGSGAGPNAAAASGAPGAGGRGADWRIFRLPQLIEKARAARSPYLEFLRVPDLSCGVYRLAAGARDLQGPHDEDELYFVVEGRARLRVGDEDVAVEPGSILFVRATEDHSFFEIEEDMVLLVFFASGGPSET